MNQTKTFQSYTEAKAFYEAQQGDCSLASSKENGWIVQYTAESKDSETPITVRGNGKCHPAIMHSRYGLIITCHCPGSQNGSLVHRVRKVCDGHDKVNCGN